MVLDLAVLALAGLAAGYVNAIAGAGSLLTLPALIFTGLDAGAANATNRVAVLLQAVAGVAAYRRSGIRTGRIVVALAIPTGAAAVAGAWVATLLDEAQLRIAIVAAMGVFLALTLVRPRKPDEAEGEADRAEEEAPPPPPPAFRWTMVPGFVAIGFYAGFLQAGVGILILLFLSLGYRSPLVAANGVKMGLVVVFAAVSLVAFWLAGETIDLPRGLALSLSTMLGTVLGARAAVRGGERFVRAAMVLAVLASMGKLLWDLAA